MKEKNTYVFKDETGKICSAWIDYPEIADEIADEKEQCERAGGTWEFLTNNEIVSFQGGQLEISKQPSESDNTLARMEQNGQETIKENYLFNKDETRKQVARWVGLAD